LDELLEDDGRDELLEFDKQSGIRSNTILREGAKNLNDNLKIMTQKELGIDISKPKTEEMQITENSQDKEIDS
jgi:hypothetical protein